MPTIHHLRTIVCLAACAMLAFTFGCSEQPGSAEDGAARSGGGSQELVIYSGRGRALVEPIIERFREESGIDVQVRYGDTAQLAVTLLEEGEQSPADVFWAQDAGALGQLAGDGRFAPIPEALLERVPEAFRHPGGYWVATSARARVVAYASENVDADEIPDSVFDLTDEKWAGRVGWAPTNGSFQAFVTAMRHMHGDDATLQWLRDMKNNDAQVYAKNSPIITALGNGEVDLGLVNHYYLLRTRNEDPDFPVEQTMFEAGDVGNLLLVSGVGIIQSAANRDAAEQFIAYLLSSDAANHAFAEENFEYAVSADAPERPELPDQGRLDELAPEVPLDALDDLEGTLNLLREAGLL